MIKKYLREPVAISDYGTPVPRWIYYSFEFVKMGMILVIIGFFLDITGVI